MPTDQLKIKTHFYTPTSAEEFTETLLNQEGKLQVLAITWPGWHGKTPTHFYFGYQATEAALPNGNGIDDPLDIFQGNVLARDLKEDEGETAIHVKSGLTAAEAYDTLTAGDPTNLIEIVDPGTGSILGLIVSGAEMESLKLLPRLDVCPTP